MTINREQLVVVVCLAAACGGEIDSPFDSLREHDADLVAAIADSPGQGEVVCKNKVVFFGRSGAPVGSTIIAVSLDGQMIRRTCSGKVASDRTWSCTQTLPDGGYSWTAQVASGGPLSQQIDFVVTTRGHAAPLIDHTPSPNNDPRPVLTGTVDGSLANKGLRLEVKDNGITVCTVNPIRSTNWACPLAANLADGPHLFTAKVELKEDDDDEHDFDENDVTPLANPNAFVVKTSIGRPTLAAIPTPSSQNAVPFTGTGEPGAMLTMSEGDRVLCQATVAPGGRWSCMAPDPLADGAHSVSATQQDAAGNTSGAVSASFVIDTHIPGAPTLDAPATPAADPRVTFTGTGEAGARVSVLDSYSRLLCSAAVSAPGAWSCAPPGGLQDGDYVLTALQTTAVGRVSGPSASVPLSVRTLLAPLFDAPASPTRDSAPLLTGAAQAGTSVSVFRGEVVVCSAVAGLAGRWSCHPDPAFDDGIHLLQARVADFLGHASDASVTRSLRVDTQAPAAPVLEQPVLPTRKRQPILGGTAEAGASIVVLEAGTSAAGANAATLAVLCQTKASAAGLFQCSPAAAFTVGEHRVTATATDDAGNTSLEASPVGVVISEALAAPTIDSPANGARVSERRPVIEGRTAPGTLVEVTVDAASWLAQVAADGRWTVLPPEDLSLADHHVSAVATDQGQETSDAAVSTFSIAETEAGFARGGCASGGAPGPLLALAALLLVAARKRRAGIALALTLVAVPAVLRAQEIDVSSFRPAAGGDGFAGVEGARPPIEGEPRLEVRTWTDYAVHPLRFVTSSGTERNLVRDRAVEWLGAQLHLLGPLSLSAQMPVTVLARGELASLASSATGTEPASGFADLRLTPRLSLLRQESAGLDLSAQMSFEFPTGRGGSFSSDGTVRVEGLLALGGRLGAVGGGWVDLLGNVYVRSRPARELLDVRSGTEGGLRGGLGYALASSRAWLPRRIYAELEGRSALRAGFAAGSAPAEWRLGGTLCPVGNLALDIAGGGALSNGIGAPRARFLFGIGWSPGACQRTTAKPLAAAAPAPVSAPAAPPQPIVVVETLPPPPMMVDRDGDGIPDADDACPEQAGPAENHGCPPGIPWRVIVSSTTLEILDRVHFATGKAQIEKRSYTLLDQVAAVIQSHPNLLLIQVEGHTDDRGGASYNLLLSQARADAVTGYLIGKGVARDRLAAKGFGPTRPVGSNATTTGRAANRRVAFTVIKTQAREIEAQRPPDS